MNLVLIDGMFFVRRSVSSAEKAMPKEEGKPWHAPVFIALRSYISMVKQYPAKYIFCWDRGRSGKREIFAGYKASRDSFNPHMDVFITAKMIEEDLVPAVGADSALFDGFEADDVIASICHSTKDSSLWRWKDTPESKDENTFDEVRIFSTDYDFFALIDDKIKCWRPGIMKNPEVIADADYCREHFGVKPLQIRMLKALIGDSSDEYPGVKTGRKKTDLKHDDLVQIAKVLKESDLAIKIDFESASNGIYLNEGSLSVRISDSKRVALVNSFDQIKINFALAGMKKDLPVVLKRGQFDKTKFTEFCQKYEFKSLVSKIDEISSQLERTQ